MRFEILHSDNAFAFQLVNDDNQPVANSKLYPTVDACVEGIRTFAQAAASQPHFSLRTENDKHLFTAQLAGQELLRSVAFDNVSAARTVADTLIEQFTETREFEVSYTQPMQAAHRSMLQPDLDSYDFTQRSQSGEAGFEPLQNTANTQYYFHFNDVSGQAFLYSQAYASAASRDNGIRSVIQNAPKQARYEQRVDDGLHFFILKAINGREVARSRHFETATEASAFATQLQQTTSLFEEKYAKPNRIHARNGNRPHDSYHFQVASRSGLAGFESFQGDAKQHYFHFNDATGRPVLFSQGYSHIAARDNGIRAVIRNAHKEDRYVRIIGNGMHSFMLRAGNNQEIARSRPYTTATECETARAYLKSHAKTHATQYQVELRGEIPQIAETRRFSIHVEPPPGAARHTDGYDFTQTSPAGTPGYESFYSERNRAFYFHFNDSDGRPLLFSESYPDATTRDKGLQSVQKNALLKDQWRMLQDNGRYAYSLRAGNNQEIARSLWLTDEMAAVGVLAAIQKGTTGAVPSTHTPMESVSAQPASYPQEPVLPSEFELVDIPRPTPRTGLDTAYEEFPLYRYEYVQNHPAFSTLDDPDSPDYIHEPVAAGSAPAETVFSIPNRAGWVAAGLLVVMAGGAWWYNSRQAAVSTAAGGMQANTAETAYTQPPSATLAADAAATPAPVVMTRFQPIALYFNNDYPGPRTQDSTTTLTYGQTFEAYYKQRDLFATAYSQDADNAETARTEIDVFFDQKVKKGYADLNALSAQLLQKLDEGLAVEITVTGFASPLASNNYNQMLTSRRVHSVENHFRTYRNGVFNQYLADERLVITEQASGEDRASQSISDDRTDARRSRYSPEASAERRVEITNVTIRRMTPP